jgi:hypothetical protein
MALLPGDWFMTSSLGNCMWKITAGGDKFKPAAANDRAIAES